VINIDVETELHIDCEICVHRALRTNVTRALNRYLLRSRSCFCWCDDDAASAAATSAASDDSDDAAADNGLAAVAIDIVVVIAIVDVDVVVDIEDADAERRRAKSRAAGKAAVYWGANDFSGAAAPGADGTAANSFVAAFRRGVRGGDGM
jgi:hypothetical protein